MKIAVLGSASSSVNRAPFKDSRFQAWMQGRVDSLQQAHDAVPGDWDIWGCSPGCWAVAPRATRWFELHRWEANVQWFSPEYVQFLRSFKGPVYTGGVIHEIQNHVVYPIDYLEEKFSSYFMTSSLALMVAMAIDEIERIRLARAGHRRFKEELDAGIPHASEFDPLPQWVGEAELDKPDSDDVIGLWGVDMAAQDEYCVAPETRVLTADLRWVPVDELAEGDQLIAFDDEAGGDTGTFRAWRLSTVQGVQRLRRPCKRLHMEDGTTLVSSDEHRWLTYAEHENRWKETAKLVTPAHRAGRPTRIVKLSGTWTEDKSWEAGYLAAAFDGEGHLIQIEREECDGVQFMIGFSQRENAMSETVLSACRSMGFDLRVAAVEGGQNGDCIKYRLAGQRSEIMEFLGRIRPRRLMAKFKPGVLGKMQRKDAVAVVSMEDLGEQEVVGLKTSTGTFVAEGFASHNSYQRPGCQFFILEALRRGIGVYLPAESDLMRPMPVYGISEWDHNYIKLTSRARELNQAITAAQKQMSEASTQVTGAQGEQHALQAFVSTWTSPYGMLPGMVIRQAEGTGLGSGITHFDGRPIARMNVAPPSAPPAAATVQAMADPKEAQLGRELCAILVSRAGERGQSEGAAETLQRIIAERDALQNANAKVLERLVREREERAAKDKKKKPPRKRRR